MKPSYFFFEVGLKDDRLLNGDLAKQISSCSFSLLEICVHSSFTERDWNLDEKKSSKKMFGSLTPIDYRHFNYQSSLGLR